VLPALPGLHRDELAAWFADSGEPAYRVDQLLDWVWRKHAPDFDSITNLPVTLREKLAASFRLHPLEHVKTQGADDTTRKFLFRLHDGRFVETVLIPASPALYGSASDRRTLCVSSQVGCAYGCKFCASGLAGFTRNLDAGEIAAQVLAAATIAGERIDNVVFMGMGEPLANLDALLASITIITAPWGPHIGARHLTISTSGLVPEIRQLAEHPQQIRLAISLHGATDDVREQTMPINRRYPLAELFSALDHWNRLKKQHLTLEYILIDGINDSLDQAKLLARHARRLHAKVNLIPYNTVDGLDWKRPPEAHCRSFHDILRDAGAIATLRIEKGHDIDAACGQLRLKEERQLP